MLLGRAPAAAAFDATVADLDAGTTTVTDLARTLLSSSAYEQRFG